ncbi:MAG: ATPase domain-containing protein, partial [Candidatus Micrarchaeota archaeon]
IYGLDELLGGGFLKQRSVLVSGACGTGKTIFSLQFLYKGIVEAEEPGVFVTFDEMPEKIRQDMLQFKMNLKELEDNDLLTIIDATSARAGVPSEEEHAILPGQLDLDKVLIEVLGAARNIGAKRLVIDSIPAMAVQLETEGAVRKAILKLAYIFSRSGLTTVMTSEIPEQTLGSGTSMQFSKYDVEEYIADGVILLNFLGIGSGATRTLYIRKMRGTAHSMEIHPMEITEKGIVVRKIEEVFR